MDFIDEVYSKTKEIRDMLYNHPVVIAIENENLAIDKFKFYMLEDYLYLRNHLKVFSIGILKSKDHNEISNFIMSLYNCLINEMDIHRKYMRELSIDIDDIENRKPNIITTSYSNFRISKAIQGDYLDVAMILLACDLSYSKIIQKINRNNPNVKNNKVYGKWIKGYLDPFYDKQVSDSINIFNKNSKNLTDKRRAELVELFNDCLKYELMFWDMVNNMGQ